MRRTESLTIRTAIGIIMVAFGISQMKNPRSWFHYVPEWIDKLLPITLTSFMHSHGATNIGLGLLFMSGWRPVFISWSTFAWWLSILPFAAQVDWRSGARDFGILAGILAVALSAGKYKR